MDLAVEMKDLRSEESDYSTDSDEAEMLRRAVDDQEVRCKRSS